MDFIGIFLYNIVESTKKKQSSMDEESLLKSVLISNFNKTLLASVDIYLKKICI
jgi:hypothetical protein